MRTAIIIAGWAWFLVALPGVTNTLVGLERGLLLLLSGPVVALLWLAHSVNVPGVLRGKRWWVWWSVPLCGLIPVVLAYTGWGLVARVWACESQLREFAVAVQRG